MGPVIGSSPDHRPGCDHLRERHLSPGTTYYYRIIATNAGGDSTPSNVASAKTEKPPSDTDGIAPITEAPAAGGALAADTQAVDGLSAPQTEKPLEGSASVDGDPVAVEGIESTAPTP